MMLTPPPSKEYIKSQEEIKEKRTTAEMAHQAALAYMSIGRGGPDDAADFGMRYAKAMIQLWKKEGWV